MEEENEEISKEVNAKVEGKINKKNKKVFLLMLIVVVAIAIAYLIMSKKLDKNYEIEQVTQFSYFKLYENEKYGVIDTNGTILVEPKYDMLVIPNPSKAVFIGYFNYNSQTGEYQTEVLNDKNEKIFTKYTQVLPLALKDISTEIPYEKSVLEYKENNKYGIIDFKGKKITNAIYDSIESLQYKEGCLLVKQGEKYGIINIKGKTVIGIEYDSISADGYYDKETQYQKAGFVVGQKKQEGYRYGYINNQGKTILEVEYNEVNRIIEEMKDDDIYLLALQNGQAGIYQNKKQIIKHSYEEIEYNSQNQMFLVQKNGKQGVLDIDGKEILKPEYDYIMISTESINAQKDGITTSYNKKGEKQETQTEKTIVTVENSQYYITIDKQDKFGLIDKDQNVILENEYSYIEYSFGNYFIVTKNRKVGIYDASKKQEIISNYDVIYNIENKQMIQTILLDPYTIEFYNENMEKIVSMKEANIQIEENYVTIFSKTERKYLNNRGNEISYKELFPNLTLYAFQAENGKWGYQDKEGNTIIEAKYDMALELNNYGFAGIMQDDKWGVINSKAEIIVEPTYEIESDKPEFIGIYYKLDFGYGMNYYTKEK